MKKLIIAILGTTTILTLLIGSTFSYMTAEAENASNVITTGTMKLNTNPQHFMALSGLMPGGPAQEATVSVFADTPTKFFYKVKSVRQVGTSTKLWNALMVEVKDDISGETWTGNLNSLETGWFARSSGVGGGGLNTGHVVRFKLWIPQEADVDAGTTATVMFRFNSEQWRPL